MAINSSASNTLAQPKFRVTYGTGGIKSLSNLRVISLAQFHERLLAKRQAETNALHELWEPFTIHTREERYQQHRTIEATFPFVVAGVAYDREADLADEEDLHAGWQQPSGLVVLSFNYGFVKGNAERTAVKRERLQKQLLASPLLGPSIVLMSKEPGECIIYVFIAAGAIKSYSARVHTIVNYLKAACPKLHRKLCGAAPNANERYSVGFDPLAYLRPRPVEGYPTFPVKQVQAAMIEGKQKLVGGPALKLNSSRKK
jgi:hypothetical protein